jgi:FkbM family methyltransferase
LSDDLTRAERFTAWFLRRAPEAVIRLTASAIGRAKPLAPDPGWFFDRSHDDRSPLIVFRRGFWNYFKERRLTRPVTMRWYERLRIRAYLGNDLSKCLYVDGSFEPNEFALLAAVLGRGMTYVDVGANDGLYTLYAARRVGRQGRVIAVEPSRREYERLIVNIRLNRLRNVEARRCALYDRDGEMTLAVAGYGHEGQNTLGEVVANPQVETQGLETVAVTTLDALAAELALSRLDALKLDVEGSEEHVLRGGSETIRRFRPLIQLEVEENALEQQGSTKQELVDALRDLDYRLFVFDDETAELRPPAGDDELRMNVIAAPTGWTPPMLAEK